MLSLLNNNSTHGWYLKKLIVLLCYSSEELSLLCLNWNNYTCLNLTRFLFNAVFFPLNNSLVFSFFFITPYPLPTSSPPPPPLPPTTSFLHHLHHQFFLPFSVSSSYITYFSLLRLLIFSCPFHYFPFSSLFSSFFSSFSFILFHFPIYFLFPFLLYSISALSFSPCTFASSSWPPLLHFFLFVCCCTHFFDFISLASPFSLPSYLIFPFILLQRLLSFVIRLSFSCFQFLVLHT